MLAAVSCMFQWVQNHHIDDRDIHNFCFRCQRGLEPDGDDQ